MISVIGHMQYRRIRELREDKDYTQIFVGRSINVPQRTYSYYENGERCIPPEVLSRIADFHNTSVDYLLGRTNVREPYPNEKNDHTVRNG